MSARIAAGVYLSCAALLAACETALEEAERSFPAVAVGVAGASSADRGSTWAAMPSLPAGTFYAVTFRGPQDIVAVGDNTALTSDDGGVTWTSRTIPAGTYYSVASDGLDVVAVGNGVAATSADGGATWTSRTIPAGLYRGVARDGLNVVAVGASAAATSSDGGETWTSRSIPAGYYYAVARDGLNVVAVGASAAATSVNGGTNWTNRTIPAGTYRSVARSGSDVVAVGETVAATSVNGGAAWTSRTVSANYFYGVARDGLNVVAVGSFAAMVSDDGGVTWTDKTIPGASYNAVALFPGGIPGAWSTSVSSTGRVTLTNDESASLKFSTGSHSATSARDVLGFGAVDTAGGTTHTGTKQHQNGWYPELPVVFDSRSEQERTAVTSIAQSGQSQAAVYGSPRELRRAFFDWLPEWKTKIACEGDYLNEALERLWRDGYARFRWWPDATVEGTYHDVLLDPKEVATFAPGRDERLQLYSYDLRMRKFIT